MDIDVYSQLEEVSPLLAWLAIGLGLLMLYCTGLAQVSAWREVPEPRVPNPRRKWLHIAVGLVGFGYLYTEIAWWLMPLVWSLGFLVALFLFPHPRFAWMRYGERSLVHAPADVGVLAYPTVMYWTTLLTPTLAPLLLIPLAFGDGFASIIGGRYPEPRLPWNPQKTVSGTLAFLVATIGGFCTLRTYVGFDLLIAFFIGGVLALTESWPSRYDDNLRLALAFALCLVVIFATAGRLGPVSA